MWVLVFGPEPSGEFTLVHAASVLPTVWNMMLAARGQGLGTALTTMLGMYRNSEVCDLLGVPGGWVNYAAVSVGIPKGRWGVAKRQPAQNVAFSERWDQAVDWTVDEPLWPKPSRT